MANPFNWRHQIYAMDGLMLGAILGLIVGLVLMVLLISATSTVPSANTNMITFFYYFPLIFTLVGAGFGYFMGIVYSHEKEEKDEKASQLPIITLPQASGSQTPIILVHQPQQQPQVPQILILPQAGQQPIVVTPQQAQQQK
jgi:ABC-type amino acid transport system permease subunit